jgi:cytochrome c-type biogenesis protein CcmH
MKIFSYFLLFVSYFVFTQEALNLYSFSTEDHKQRFYSLAEEISCPLCEGSSINGSSSPIAKDMKNIIFNMILENKSDDQIKFFLTEKFGDDILYMPPINNFSYFLFLFPIILILLSAYFLYLVLQKNDK